MVRHGCRGVVVGEGSKMTPQKIETGIPARHHQLLYRAAIVACGAISGAAVLLSAGTLADRWFALTPDQAPLALVGGLAGAGAVLVALALTSLSSPKDGVCDAIFDAPTAWMLADMAPLPRTPMTWTPMSIYLPHALSVVDARSTAALRRTVAARRCAVRRRGGRLNTRRAIRSMRAIPPMET